MESNLTSTNNNCNFVVPNSYLGDLICFWIGLVCLVLVGLGLVMLGWPHMLYYP